MPWGTSFPTFFGGAALVRAVALRERVNVVHAHQNFSPIAHEAAHAARALGVPVVFTDHSLFGFADTAGVLTNALLRWTLAEVQAVVCVSNISKENSVLRSGVRPDLVYVIPNAVDTRMFVPLVPRHGPRHVGSFKVDADPYSTVVVMNRLTYRKGVDLLVQVIPAVCTARPDVRFIVGGDGPRRAQLEQMIDAHALHERVLLLGEVRHAEVNEVLNRGRVFLNCSLTEAFCMAVVEAACAGLFVVSTRVGGVPEVLPPELILLAEPEAGALAAATLEGLRRAHDEADRNRVHDAVAGMYSWRDVAERTEITYGDALAQPALSLSERLERYTSAGGLAGLGFATAAAAMDLYMVLLELWRPAANVERAAPFPHARYRRWAEERLGGGGQRGELVPGTEFNAGGAQQPPILASCGVGVASERPSGTTILRRRVVGAALLLVSFASLALLVYGTVGGGYSSAMGTPKLAGYLALLVPLTAPAALGALLLNWWSLQLYRRNA